MKMRVRVKLYATLQRYAPTGTELGQHFEVAFDGTSIGDLISHLGLKKDQAKIVMVNGNRATDLETELNENDIVVIFPPVGGG